MAQLKVHVDAVHELRQPYTCDFPDCLKTFSHRSSLNRHLKGVHRCIVPTEKEKGRYWSDGGALYENRKYRVEHEMVRSRQKRKEGGTPFVLHYFRTYYVHCAHICSVNDKLGSIGMSLQPQNKEWQRQDLWHYVQEDTKINEYSVMHSCTDHDGI